MSFREHLYPAKIGLLLAIGSIILYFFFNLWPLAFSIGMAFTNANERNLFVNPEVIVRFEDTLKCIGDLRTRAEIEPQYQQSFVLFIDTTIRTLDGLISKAQELITIVEESPDLTMDIRFRIQRDELYLNALRLRLIPDRLNAILDCKSLGYYNARELIEKRVLLDIDSLLASTSRLTTVTDKETALTLLNVTIDKSKSIREYLSMRRDLIYYLDDIESSIEEEKSEYELRFIGLSNFQRLFSDARFYYSLFKTFLFVVTSVPLKVITGLSLALLYSTPLIYGRKIMRGLMLAPWAIPILLSGLTWQFMVSKGPLATPLSTLFGVPVEVGVLNSEYGAFLVYNLFETWLAYPFIMTVTMGALASMSRDIIEAAYIDGAGLLTRLRKVVLPQISRPLMTATILTTGASLQAFMVPLLINSGGPSRLITIPYVGSRHGNVNELLILFGYNRAMIDKDWGYAASSYLVIVLIIMVYVIAWMTHLRKTKR